MSILIKKYIDKDGYFGGEYYFSPIVDNKELSYISESEDMAMLIGLGYKYDGINSQFPKMAARMLGIKSKWAEQGL